MGVTVREKPVGSGNYHIFINHQGKRRSQSAGKDKRLANVLAEKIRRELRLHREVAIDEAKIPRFVDFAGGWIETFRAMNEDESSFAGCRHIIESQLLPFFGETQLHKITREHLKRFLRHQVEAGHATESSLKECFQCLSAVLDDAVDDGFIPSNPVDEIQVGGEGRWE